METCANCHRAIGDLESHCVYQGKVVCVECDKKLRDPPVWGFRHYIGPALLNLFFWGGTLVLGFNVVAALVLIFYRPPEAAIDWGMGLLYIIGSTIALFAWWIITEALMCLFVIAGVVRR